MAARNVHFYPQCPDYDGTELNAPSPTQQRADILFNYTRQRGTQARPLWRPGHCRFSRIDDPDHTPHEYIYERCDLEDNADRQRVAATYRCTRHARIPNLWARASAFRRRHNPIQDAHWEGRAENLVWTGPDHRERRVVITVWYSRRPAPRTMHTAWQQLAKA